MWDSYAGSRREKASNVPGTEQDQDRVGRGLSSKAGRRVDGGGGGGRGKGGRGGRLLLQRRKTGEMGLRS